MKSSFLKAGHTPTLLSAFLYFDLSFMVWVLLGPLAVQIAADLSLTPAQKGLMVATPVLAGALLRIVMGVLVDQIKPKNAGTIGQIIVIISLLTAWLHGLHTFQQTLMLGIGLGFAGAAFAVALPLASRWYHQNIKAQPWVLQAQVTLVLYLPLYSHLVWLWHMAGITYSVWL